MSGVFYCIKLWELFKLNWTPIFLQLQQASCPASTVTNTALCSYTDNSDDYYVIVVLVKIPLLTYKSYLAKFSLSWIRIILSSHAKLTWIPFNKSLTLKTINVVLFWNFATYSVTSILPKQRLFPPTKTVDKIYGHHLPESAVEASSHGAEIEV